MSKQREMNDSELQNVSGGNTVQNVDGTVVGGAQVEDGDTSVQPNESLGDCGMIRGTGSGSELSSE